MLTVLTVLRVGAWWGCAEEGSCKLMCINKDIAMDVSQLRRVDNPPPLSTSYS